MSEDNNIYTLSHEKATKLAKIFAKHYREFGKGAASGLDEMLIELGQRGSELRLLPNDVLVLMCAWYYWVFEHEMEGEYGVEGDVKSAFVQFAQRWRIFDLTLAARDGKEI